MQLLRCIRRENRTQSFSYDLLLLSGISACGTVHFIYDQDHLARLILIDGKASEVICHIRIEKFIRHYENKNVRSSDRVIRYLIVIGTERCVDTGSVNYLKAVPFVSVCLFGRDFRARCNSLITRDHLYDRRLSC